MFHVSVIMLPEVLFCTKMISGTYKVPWGTAFIRAKEEGFIYEEKRTVNGQVKSVAVWKHNPILLGKGKNK